MLRRMMMAGPEGPPPGPYPVIEEITTSYLDPADTAIQVSMPLVVNVGDLLLLLVGGSSSNSRRFDVVSGWTEVYRTGVTPFPQALFSKVAAGTEGGIAVSVPFLSSSAVAVGVVIRVRAGSYHGAIEVVPDSGSSSSPLPAALSPSWGSASTKWVAALTARGMEGVTSFPFPGGNTYISTPTATGLDGAQAAVCWQDQVASSVSPGAFSLNTSRPWRTLTIGIRPA